MKIFSFLLLSIALFNFSNAQNLAVNGGFENWTAGALDTWVADSGVTISEETSIFSEGSKSAKFFVTTQSQGDTDVRQTVSVEAGKVYNVSMDVYQLDNEARARLYVDGYQGYSDPETLNQWQTISYQYEAAATGDIEIGMRFYDVATWVDGSEMYVDNFVFEEANTTAPSIVITDPQDGANLAVGTTSYTMTVAVQNFDMPTQGHYHVILDGTDVGNNSADGATTFELTNLTTGTHTLKVILNNPNHVVLDPEVSDEVSFTIPEGVTVANLAELRSQNADNSTVYTLSGEAFINYAQNFRNQKYIQDASAGILIDDSAGNITVGQRGEVLTNLVGTLLDYQGMLQFVPVQDATVATNSQLTITPQNVTLSELASNFDAYEAELVTIEPVTFNTTAEANFVNGTSYEMTATMSADMFNYYTTFYNVDYTDTAINTAGYSAITGLPFERNNEAFFCARDLADFTNLGVEDLNQFEESVQLSNTLVRNTFSVLLDGEAVVEVYNMNGQLLKTQNGTDSIEINAGNLPQGAYVVRVIQGTNFVTKKFIKQ